MCATIDPPTRSITLPAEVCDMITELLVNNRAGFVGIHIANGRIGSVEQKRQIVQRKTASGTVRA